MSAFLTVALIHFLALISPGPDFALITKQSLTRSRRSAIWMAAGIASANLVHVGYCILGIAVVISRSIVAFNVLKYLGAAYLLYIGWKALRAKPALTMKAATVLPQAPERGLLHALGSGFICNILNPKCTLFFLALFTQVIDPSTPAFTQLLYGLWIAGVSFVWFCVVASVFSLASIRKRYERMGHWIERAMGAVLIALGIRVALSTNE